MSELRRIGALASAYDIPVNPHAGGLNGAVQWSISHVNGPWAELFMPPPGGPKEVYDLFDENYEVTEVRRDSICTRRENRMGVGFGSCWSSLDAAWCDVG